MKKFKLNRVVKNFLSLTMANVIGQAAMFIAVIYTARYFGPSEFGIINFSNVIVTYFTAIANFGLQTLGTIEIAKSNENKNFKINTIISLRLVLAIVAYILIILVSIFINRSIEYKLSILFYGLTVFPTAIYVDWIFNANEEMQYNSHSIIIKNFLYSALVIVSIFIFRIKNVYYLALFMFLSTLISSVYLLRIVKVHYNIKFKFILDIKEYKRLIFSAWPFFFSGIFATINSNIATLMLGFMRSDYEIGIYNSVYKIVNVFTMIAGLLFTPVYPLLIKYYSQNKKVKLNLLLNNLRKIVYVIAVPLVFVAFVLNKEIVTTLYGSKYQEAYSIFTLLIIYAAIFFIREIYGYALNAWSLQKKYMIIVLISSLYNIISNIIFINKFGIQGASLNTLVSEIINLVLMAKVGISAVKIKYQNLFIIKIIGCSIVMSLFIKLFRNITSNGITLSILGAFTYFICIFIFRVITKEDLKTNFLERE